jgi:hypothetical protein
VLSPNRFGVRGCGRRFGSETKGGSPLKPGDHHYQDRVVRLAELVGSALPPIIKGFTFDGCHIVGPAIVNLQRSEDGPGCQVNNCMLDGEPDALFVQLAAEQHQLIGAIVLQDCQFDRCRFQGIGFLDKGRELRSALLAA